MIGLEQLKLSHYWNCN